MAARKASLIPSGPLRLERAGEPLIDPDRIALLEAIGATGSITHAAKAAGLSYRTAWLAVDHLNALADEALVERSQGGRAGGGTRLTPYGRRLIDVYRAAAREHAEYLARLRGDISDLDRFLALTRKLALRTSARNQLFGTAAAIRADGLFAEVSLGLKGGDALRSRITRGGLESLGLRVGDEAYALIKANWLELRPARTAAPRGRNALPGKVEAVETAGRGREIRVRLQGGASLVSTAPGRGRWRPGDPCLAVFRPEDVILGVAR